MHEYEKYCTLSTNGHKFDPSAETSGGSTDTMQEHRKWQTPQITRHSIETTELNGLKLKLTQN